MTLAYYRQSVLDHVVAINGDGRGYKTVWPSYKLNVTILHIIIPLLLSSQFLYVKELISISTTTTSITIPVRDRTHRYQYHNHQHRNSCTWQNSSLSVPQPPASQFLYVTELIIISTTTTSIAIPVRDRTHRYQYHNHQHHNSCTWMNSSLSVPQPPASQFLWYFVGIVSV